MPARHNFAGTILLKEILPINSKFLISIIHQVMGGNVLSGNFISRKMLFVFIAVLFLGGSAAASRCAAQQKKMPQTAGVDNSKMGPYRALAQLAFAASQKGENALAAKLARILERDWDKSEDYGGDAALSQTNHA